MMKINWNDVLPETIIAEWQNILENVNVINSLKLERHYLKMFDLEEVEIIELHWLSDASLKAYVAVIYIRFKLKDGSYRWWFVASKTKINPIRLETPYKLAILPRGAESCRHSHKSFILERWWY